MCAGLAYTNIVHRTPGTSTIGPSPDESSTHDVPYHVQYSIHSMHKPQWDGLETGPYSRGSLTPDQFVSDIPATRETGHCLRNVLNSTLETEGPIAPAISTRVASWNPHGAALSYKYMYLNTVLGPPR